MKRFFISLFAAVMLASCAEAPEEVQRENSILDNAETVSKEESVDSVISVSELCTPDEIRARLESDIAGNNTNIVLKNVRVGKGSSMPVYDSAREYSDYKEAIVKAVSDVFGEDINSEIKGSIEVDEKIGIIFYIPEGKTRDSGVSASVNGAIGITYEFSDEYGMPAAYGKENLVKTYLLTGTDTDCIDAYLMTDDKELTVKDAAAEAERLFNTYFLIGGSVSYKINRLDVYKYPDGKHGFAYYMDAFDKDGNIMAANLNPVVNISNFNEQKTFYPFDRIAYGYFTDSEMHPYAYTNVTPSEGKVTEKGDKLLSLKSAADILSQRLASSAVYEFDEAELAYLAVINPAEGLVKKDRDGNFTIFDPLEYFMGSENQMELRPFWVFRDSNKSTPEYSIGGGLYTIDALTGELYIF